MSETPSVDTKHSLSLKRSGKSPLRLDGNKYIEAIGWDGKANIWYEINIYTNIIGGFVCEIKALKKLKDEKDIFYAETFEDLDGLVQYLEAHNAKKDISYVLDTESPSQSATDLALQAVMIKQRQEEARREYSHLIGELLYQLPAE